MLAYLAFAAHLVPVVQAFLLGGAQGVPGHNEVTESDVHLAISLCLSCGEKGREAGFRGEDSWARNTQWSLRAPKVSPDLSSGRRGLTGASEQGLLWAHIWFRSDSSAPGEGPSFCPGHPGMWQEQAACRADLHHRPACCVRAQLGVTVSAPGRPTACTFTSGFLCVHISLVCMCIHIGHACVHIRLAYVHAHTGPVCVLV